jgi:hypothetical protein
VTKTIDDDVNREARRLEPMMTEIIEGPVTPADRVYAFDEIRSICRAAPRAVQRARARLWMAPEATGGGLATADCSLLVDGALIICAGAAARTMREAVDGLTARLRGRVEHVETPIRRVSGRSHV